MQRPVHFEIHANNPDRAIAFYNGMFDWTFTKWDGPWPYWLIDTGSGMGINGGLIARQGPQPVEGQAVNAFVITVDVPSCDRAIAQAAELGGSLALEKMEIPGMGWLAYVKDTEGNILGVMQGMTAP